MNLACPACGATNRVPDARLHERPVCGRCKAELLPAHPVALTDASFPAFIAGTEMPVLVDFWADWCGPCKAMAPHFANAVAQLPDVRLAKVDTDANPQASVVNRIRSIPTLVLYRAGQELARQSGAMASTNLVQWVRTALARGA